ncbi:GumC family protein [Sphingomonas sp. DBB INV C78]|uniref:GumC family protein n=1 Tax=Sphingomonas sp. DBB INV C78 TaxID=3349434 RepID=UPI0036D2D8E6
MSEHPLDLPGPSPISRRQTMIRTPVREDAHRPDRGGEVRRLFAILRRRWMVFAAVFLFVVFMVGLFTLRQTPLYAATANLIVNSRLVNVATKEKEVVPSASTDESAVDSEIQILKSPAVTNRVVEDLQLDRRPEFAKDVQQLSREDAIAAIGGMLRSQLLVERPGGTNVLAITYTSPDPVLAARVSNSVARQYLAVKANTRVQAAQMAGSGLGKEIDQLRGKLEAAERDVASYRAANNLLSADGVTLTEQEIALYKQQDAQARVALAEEQARLNTARSQMARGSRGDDVGEALNSPVVEQLRGKRAETSGKLAELQARYRPTHPDVVKAQRQLEDIDAAIQAEIGRVVSNLEARVSVAQQRAGTVSGISSGARGQLAASNAASVRLNELERRAEAYRSNYAAMLERQNAVSTQALVSDDDARLFSPALVPQQPSFPNKKLNLLLGALAGLIAAGLTVWLLHFFDRGLASSHDVEEKLGIPHVANLAEVRTIAEREDRDMPPIDFVVERPMALLAEAVRGLRLHIEKWEHEGPGGQVIGLTSASPGEGKSTLAVMLARVSALAGRRTLLIDGDLRRPSIAKLLNLKPKLDLEDVLNGKAWIEEACVLDEKSGAWVLPTIAKPFTHAEIVGREVMEVLLLEARRRFDLIIIDAAPALAAVDARALLQHVDAMLMVVRWNVTPLPMIRAALKKLRPLGIEPAGIVLSRVNMKAIAAYGVDDVDYHYRSYANYGAT